jgi:hypothetical protein
MAQALAQLSGAFAAPAYNQVKEYLKDMLCTQLEHCKTHPDERTHPIFKELSVAQMVEDLRHQLEAYWQNEWPFNMPLKDADPFTWWRSLSDHPHARVLSVCTISILCIRILTIIV